MEQVEVYIDGASKGNPGPAGIGVIVCRQGEVIKTISLYIGEQTNNVAEYTALIWGLQEARAQGAKAVAVRSDSELLCRQMNGLYRVKHPNIVPLAAQAKQLLAAFQECEVVHIPREQNQGADALANQAVKEYRKNVGKAPLFGADSGQPLSRVTPAGEESPSSRGKRSG
jgi:ribonuclease HI